MPLNPGPPRKVLVGTSVISFWGDYPGPEKRVAQLGAVIDQMVAQAAERFAGGRLDLAVLPEFALTGGSKRPLADAALALDSAALAAMADKARQHRCYLLAPLHLVGDRPQHIYYNAAALFDRQGGLVGLYRYAHPSAEEISFGLTPGRQFPIFACDFGLVGVQICGDVAHDDGWLALAKKGAELILLPAQPPTPLLAPPSSRPPETPWPRSPRPSASWSSASTSVRLSSVGTRSWTTANCSWRPTASGPAFATGRTTIAASSGPTTRPRRSCRWSPSWASCPSTSKCAGVSSPRKKPVAERPRSSRARPGPWACPTPLPGPAFEPAPSSAPA